jgi:hypothetical protein
LLRARLEDRFGNALDPHRVSCMVNGQPLPTQAIVAGEARFLIRSIGYSFIDAAFADRESTVSLRATIPFAATWLQNPGLLNVGEEFRTVLYGLPRPDQPIQKAMIEIEFNPELASFIALEAPPPGAPVLSTTSTVEGNLLSVMIESETPITAQQFPDGIPVCTIAWKCAGEGNTCFRLSGRMSPTTEKWEMCSDQKRKLQSCICINVIYPPGNTAARDAGIAAAAEVPTIFSSVANVARCCPILTTSTHTCEISAADWATIAGLIGTVGGAPTVTADAHHAAVRDSGVCRRDQCINIYMIPVSVPVPGGTGQGQTLVGPPGTSVMDPTAATSGNRVGAHEVGHALGLNGAHASANGDSNNLITALQPHGTQLTAEQCKTVFQNIDSYPCA